MLLEVGDVPQDHLRYTRVSWSELTDQEFDALENGEAVDVKYLGEFTDRG